MDHPVEAFHHLRRPGYVIDGRPGILQIPGKHGLMDLAAFAMPGAMRFRHFSHAGDELVAWILFLQSLQLIEKRSVLRPAVRVEEVDSVRKLLLRRPEYDASEWRYADTARQKHGRALYVVMKRSEEHTSELQS